jgi:hypothetical protein
MRTALLAALVLPFALASGGCVGTPEPQAPPKFALRPADDMLVRRVQAAYDAVKRSARFWPGFDKTEVKAMLIYDARGEWFFGQSGDLRGFYRTGQMMNGLPINYAEPSLFLTGEVKPYARIRKQDGWLGRIGWRDFDADTSHPRSEPMMIMQELGTAKENHRSISSTEDWISVYVHECFHVFQHDFADVRKAQKIGWDETGDRDVLDKLASSGEYEGAVAAEFVILNGAVTEATTKDSARQTLRRWLAAREERIKRFAKDFAKAGGKGDLDKVDMFLTSSEGTAKYVENMYLTTPEAFDDPALAGDPAARQYVPPESAGSKKIVRRTITYRRVGNYFYTIGDLVSRLLDVADEGWKSKVFDRSHLLIGAVAALPQ